MAMETSLYLIFLGILVVLSGFFSSAEIAIFSASKIKVKELMKRKVKGASKLERLLEDPHGTLITILIGNNLVNIGASAMATADAVERKGGLPEPPSSQHAAGEHLTRRLTGHIM